MTRTIPNACPDCGSDMVLRPSRYGPFYGCVRYPACAATHGAHPDGRPLGTPANAATRVARMRAHEAFDPIWRNDSVRRRGPARRAAYQWLQDSLGMDRTPHIGEMTLEQCESVIRLCAERETAAEVSA